MQYTLVLISITQSTKPSHELSKLGFSQVLIYKLVGVLYENELQVILKEK